MLSIPTIRRSSLATRSSLREEVDMNSCSSSSTPRADVEGVRAGGEAESSGRRRADGQCVVGHRRWERALFGERQRLGGRDR